MSDNQIIGRYIVASCICVLPLIAPAQTRPSTTQMTLAQLHHEATRGNWEAILRIGDLGDKSAVPFVREFLAHPNKARGGPARNARIALAKLGESEQLELIVQDLSSDDPELSTAAFFDLAHVGGAKVIASVGPFLYSTVEYRRGRDGASDVRYEPPRYLAAKVLAQIVPNPPVRLRMDSVVTSSDVSAWREWWRKYETQQQEGKKGDE